MIWILDAISNYTVNCFQGQSVDINELPNVCIRNAGVMEITKGHAHAIANQISMLIERCWAVRLVDMRKHKHWTLSQIDRVS